MFRVRGFYSLKGYFFGFKGLIGILGDLGVVSWDKVLFFGVIRYVFLGESFFDK